MKLSENHAQILAAFVKFQGLVKNPPKNKEAKISTKNGGSYSYKYADLADIADVIRKPMADCGLAWLQNPVLDENNEVIGIYTILVHESGEKIEFDPIPVKEDDRNQTNTASQKQGSAITYARRYSLSLALGLAADEDNDAAAIQPEPDAPKQTTQRRSRKNQSSENDPQKNRKTFFAICSERKISEKRQKAIIYAFTRKESRADVTEEEYAEINKFLNNATDIQIMKKVNEGAVEKAKDEAAKQNLSLMYPEEAKQENKELNQQSDSDQPDRKPDEVIDTKGRQTTEEEFNKIFGLTDEELDDEIRRLMEGETDGGQSAANS
jgi:hypothetical protein